MRLLFSSHQSLCSKGIIRITPEQKNAYRNIIDTACHISDVKVSAWLKQTDLFKQAHIVAALIAVYGERAVFLDARIDKRLVEEAERSGNIKRFFNRRFHDKGVHWQRLVYFQTVSTKRGEAGKRKRGIANLHVHALIILPQKQSMDQIREGLSLVFGKVPKMNGRIQFKFTKPDWTKRNAYNGVTASGPIGKILYIQQGMGGTFNDLQLNDDGKRSRKAPLERLRYNRHATGLARGLPSHFNAKATLCDHVSTEMGRLAFVNWLREGREVLRELKRREARLAKLDTQSANGLKENPRSKTASAL